MRRDIVQLMNVSKYETLSLAAFVDRISQLTPQLCRAMMRQETTCISRGQITVPQIWALEMIRDRGQCAQQELLNALQLKASTGTVFVDRMCRQGLVRRSRNPANRREVLLQITRKAAKLLDEARGQRKTAFRLLFKPLPASQRASYLRLLESFLKDVSFVKGSHP